MTENKDTEPASKSPRIPIIDPKVFQPKESCLDMKKRFNSSPGWKAFADIFMNGIFWKPDLYEKQNGICPVCGEAFTKADMLCGSSIHHLDYTIECSQKDSILVPYISSSPEKVLFKMVKNCAVCKYKSPNSYLKCKNSLALFHRECHCIVHDKL